MRLSVSKFELELSGTVSELRSFRERVAGLSAGERAEISLEVDGEASPYDRYLLAACVTATEGLLRLSVESDRLVVDGSLEALIQFASSFDFPDDTETGYHVHCEPAEWHPLIHPNSMPLVISVD